MNKSVKHKDYHFEPYSLLKDILMNFWVVILAALIGLMSVSIWNGSMYTPQYTSTATLIVNLKNSASYSYTNIASASEMAQIYTEIFVQPTMKIHAAENLGQDEFVGSISSAVLPETNIFTVSVTSPYPETSYYELCSILEIYPEISQSVFADAVIEIMRYPNLPVSPSNHISASNRKLAVLGASAVVLSIIVYLSVTRDTIKDEKSFHDLVEAPLFGSISHENQQLRLQDLLKRKKRALLITNTFASFRFTENYHKIATKLEYLHRTKNVQVILVTSLAENEGKSTTAANIALSLAKRGSRVALLDMDFKKPALHKIFDLQNENFQDLAALLSGKVTFSQYSFTCYKPITGLDLALNKKSYHNYTEWLYTDALESVFSEMRTSDRYDYIIIDTPPISVAADVIGLAHLADLSLLVVRTDYVYTSVINDAIMTLQDNNTHFAGCVLNDVHKEFSLLGQLGTDENGYTGKKYYNSYSKYSSSHNNQHKL